MSTADAIELADVINRVKTWSPGLRIALAKEILESLQPSEVAAGSGSASVKQFPRGLSAEDLQDLLKTDRPAPDDETVDRWIDEYRMQKYG